MIIKFEKYLLPRRFNVANRALKHPKMDDRDKGELYVHYGIIAALMFFIVVAIMEQDRKEMDTIPFVPTDFVLSVEQIPETKYTNNPPPPPKMPVVPVASEEIDEIFEEIVFEIENLVFAETFTMPKMPEGSVGNVSVGPRLMVENLPYPDRSLIKGHEGKILLKVLVNEKGIVTDVMVIENTTNSEILLDIAKKAALQCKYQPARDKFNKPVAVWTPRTYTFTIPK